MQPTQLGPYTIRSRLGRGGMGAVYEAEEGAGGHRVAVKTLAAHLGDDASLRRRFTAEIETLKALRHPGIVQLLAFGEEDGVPYFAMELVPGQSLEQVLRAGRIFTWRETVRLALEIVRALKSAHDHGVVHRDLKPANLLLIDPPGDDGTTVKLADFGIARLFGEAGQTLAGTVVGTAEFMAPEQAAGKAVDHRADLYALGLVMFAMLTGRPPFHGGEVTRLLDRQRREAPPRVASLVAGLPPELDRLIDRLLAKDPAHRPANALAVGRVLTALESLPEQAGATAVASGQPTLPDGPTPPSGRTPSSGRTPADATPQPIDQFGDTLAMPGPAQAASPAVTQAVGRTVPQTGNVSSMEFARARTVPSTGDDERPPAARNRFTTVEEIHRVTRERVASERRRQRVWQGITAVLTAAAVAAVGFLLFRRDTAERLHARIMAIAGDEAADLRDARPLIAEFLARHAGDSRADVIREVARTLDVDALERKTRRRPRGDRPLPPIERDYRAAMARETESPAACVAALEAILAVHAADATASAASGDGESAALWLTLVRRQIDRLGGSASREREEDAARAKAVFAEAAELAAAAGTDRGAELAARRRTLLESLVELNASRPHMATAVAEARRLLDEGPAAVDAPPPEPQP